jgi:hypothetical protein
MSGNESPRPLTSSRLLKNQVFRAGKFPVLFFAIDLQS